MHSAAGAAVAEANVGGPPGRETEPAAESGAPEPTKVAPPTTSPVEPFESPPPAQRLVGSILDPVVKAVHMAPPTDVSSVHARWVLDNGAPASGEGLVEPPLTTMTLPRVTAGASHRLSGRLGPLDQEVPLKICVAFVQRAPVAPPIT